jgi:hypothetical protein
VKQIFQIERTVTRPNLDTPTYECVLGITSLSDADASLARLLSLNRGHWSIENRSHYVRDVVLDEDRCRFRTGHGACVFATLRNLVIGLLRLAKAGGIAEGIRECMWNPGLIMRLIGLENHR